ncbi:nuclear transport factor 2 family protein [Roseateles sp.]|jgi:ketosteroid isomerase-like protein|uniref:nuclear transport factor 2 family protein n=1 Tax=Roseateles sp. TaxID=1971397 RepID=UPI00391D0697
MDLRACFLAYLHAYERRDLAALAPLFAEDVLLRDWKICVRGKAAALAETRANFEAVCSLRIEVLRLYEGESGVAGELRIWVDETQELFVMDQLSFDVQGRITAIRAYLGRDEPAR